MSRASERRQDAPTKWIGTSLCGARQHDGPIDVLVTDVVMPQLSGPELAASLLRERPDLKVLYISGYPESALGNLKVLEAGTSYLPKPFSPAELARRVRMLCDGPRA